ncbi:uncharacterized protein [Apostichopus japonicus]|uniref:uncharacterized protein n=1 Tax=Stichopus japonicus TaxID=307972 RepID=UPI003AB2437C
MYLLEKEDHRPICGKDVSNSSATSVFIEIPIAQQIVNLMQKPGFYTDLQHRFHRKKSDPKNIEDLYDGIQYRRHSHNGGFFDNKNNISFMWYTDGCPIFKSSRLSMWPLYFVINELPLNKRLLKENLIYAGLWFGEKPAMGSFLKPFHESLKQLKEVGISVKVPSDEEPITVRAIVLCGTCDLPARCLVLNMTQFNGAYGCCHCKQKGKSASTGKGTTWTYPFKEVDPKGPKRTHNDMMMDAKKAYTEKKSVDGIKGPTFLSFTGCDLVHGVAIDYMHTVLLGVVRKLLHLWFDSSNHKELFSIGKQVYKVDKRLKEIKPPHFISRVPRSIKEHLGYWKASECRSWVFYYAIPVLSGILSDVYLNHFALLVEAMFLLNGDSISQEQLLHCDRLLYQFGCTFSILYGDRYMTAVVHQLVHITDVVRHLGPLWVYSCFALEDTNGSLLKMVKGTQKPELQIVANLQIMLKLPTLSLLVHEESFIKSFVKKLTYKKRQAKNCLKVSEVFDIVGTQQEYYPSEVEMKLLANYLGFVPKRCFKFLRLQLREVMFHSMEYVFVRKRNSYTVKYITNDKHAFGQVSFYLKCVEQYTCKQKFCLCSSRYVALVPGENSS